MHYLIDDTARMPANWREAFPEGLWRRRTEHVAASARLCWVRLLPGELPAQLVPTLNLPANFVILADAPSEAITVQALEAGAAGCCNTYAAPDVLRQVDVVVANGGLWVGPELLARLVRATVPLLPAADPAVQPTNPLQALSAREREVAEAVAKGLSNKQVAQGLAITERTVKAHLASVFDKLAVRDRMQLALLVARARM